MTSEDENEAEAVEAAVVDDDAGADDADDDDDQENDDEEVDEDVDAEVHLDEESMPATPAKPIDEENDDTNTNASTTKSTESTPSKKRKGNASTPASTSSKRGRRSTPKKPKRKSSSIPSVKDLGIPFRAIKRIMKIDKDIGTVQNEAAMVATFAVELFVEKMVKESNDNARKKNRNTVKYEDLAEVRASHSNLSFLNTLLP